MIQNVSIRITPPGHDIPQFTCLKVHSLRTEVYGSLKDHVTFEWSHAPEKGPYGLLPVALWSSFANYSTKVIILQLELLLFSTFLDSYCAHACSLLHQGFKGSIPFLLSYSIVNPILMQSWSDIYIRLHSSWIHSSLKVWFPLFPLYLC